jgi:DeoR family transcriptional regulator of aga operon
MLAQGRRRKIMELVEQTGQATIPDLVTRFSVSAVTARSDLDALSANGEVVRSHGGESCMDLLRTTH